MVNQAICICFNMRVYGSNPDSTVDRYEFEKDTLFKILYELA